VQSVRRTIDKVEPVTRFVINEALALPQPKSPDPNCFHGAAMLAVPVDAWPGCVSASGNLATRFLCLRRSDKATRCVRQLSPEEMDRWAKGQRAKFITRRTRCSVTPALAPPAVCFGVCESQPAKEIEVVAVRVLQPKGSGPPVLVGRSPISSDSAGGE
jgi:hypothetical protein